jgi:hypothetical protein
MTMTKMRLVLAATLTLSLSIPTVRAADPVKTTDATQSDLDLLVSTIRANRRALVEVNLNLTKDEADKFWPIYDRYQKDMAGVGDHQLSIIEYYIEHYRDLSNEKALELVDKYLAADADRIKVRRSYLPEFEKVVPGRTLARFYQIENKMDAVIRYELAATIPVVAEKPAEAGK